jgi:glutamine amidotransferase
MPEVVVIDYGMGNLYSIKRALEHLGARPTVSGDPAELAEAPRAILPGVGAFGQAMAGLAGSGLDAAIAEYAASGRPLLGICLGMQLLMESSQEFGPHQGLGLIPGRVVRFREAQNGGPRYKIPQIGWNRLELPAGADGDGGRPRLWRDTVLEGLAPGSFFYFVHSYVCVPQDPAWVLAESVYGRDRFCSVVRRANVAGCQFHPERSAELGLAIYQNFLRQS